MIGRTLNQYRILEILGKGGMGEVYLAEHTRLKREVALKVLPEDMAAAHERGITHRDLKPDNVMLDSAHRVKVFDFGLAKVTDEAAAGASGGDATRLPTATVTAEGQILGTVHYMSPEQAEDKKIDTRSDVGSAPRQPRFQALIR